jgi:CNT family concentrative nucleoside transporter
MEHPLLLRCVSLAGLLVMIALAWLISENRRAVRWRLVASSMALQFALGLLLLRAGIGLVFFDWVKRGFDLLSDASNAGASFLFGNLTQFFLLDRALVPGADGQLAPVEPFAISAVMAFKVLPVIIFVSGVAAVLQHWGVIQAVVRGMAWLMRRTLKTSGAETFATALLVFLGIESVSAVRAYVQHMTRSELFTIMTAFLSTIAASVMVAYAGFGAEAGHLLTASLMSAPAAIAMAKLIVPETLVPQTSGSEPIEMPRDTHNVFDAAAQGASLGLTMALNVGAMLIVFVGLIHLVDLATIKVTGAPVTALLGWLFRPFAWVMGVPWNDAARVSELLATKSVFNEFLAYQSMQPMIAEHLLSPRAITIATYALCGFANPGSLGIMIGALAALAPARRSEVAQLSVRAFAAGTLACFTTACVAGAMT